MAFPQPSVLTALDTNGHCLPDSVTHRHRGPLLLRLPNLTFPPSLSLQLDWVTVFVCPESHTLALIV